MVNTRNLHPVFFRAENMSGEHMPDGVVLDIGTENRLSYGDGATADSTLNIF